jgi:hypothetical protein
MGVWEVGAGKDQIFPTRLLSLRGQGKHRITKHQVYNPTITWQLLTSNNLQITSKNKNSRLEQSMKSISQVKQKLQTGAEREIRIAFLLHRAPPHFLPV